MTSVCRTAAIIGTMKAELCIIFTHRYPNRTHHHMNHHRPHRYLRHHCHHHHNQIVCTFLCTFLSMTIQTNAAIAEALHARAHSTVDNSPSSDTGEPKVCIAKTTLPSSESASTLSEEDDSVTRTVIPRRPDLTHRRCRPLRTSSSRPRPQRPSDLDDRRCRTRRTWSPPVPPSLRRLRPTAPTPCS